LNQYRYLNASEINKIEVELTSRCNAACPSCSRTDIDGKPIRSLPLEDIGIDEFKRILPEDIVAGKIVKLCGVYGDPMVARDAKEVVGYLCESNTKVVINTNASMRSPEFWSHLGEWMSVGSGHECIFSIDGLEDTNHIYRRNTSWPKIIENAKAFIAAGGYAHWDYLVFGHNEHQVEKAKELAQEMGFRKFTIKKTTRASEDKKPTALETALNIKPSEKAEFLNSQLSNHPESSGMKAVSPRATWFNKLFGPDDSRRSVACFTRGESDSQRLKEKSIYISAGERMWPCCWWAGAEFPRAKDVRDLYREHGENFNCLKENSFEAVLNHPWFGKKLVKSWYSEKTTPHVCSKNCDKQRPLNNEDCEDVLF